jgi:hypothetical protein
MAIFWSIQMLYDYADFRRMLTPILVQLGFWVGSVYLMGRGLGLIFGGFYWDGLALFVGAPIGLRVVAECLIVLFRIYERLDLMCEMQIDPALAPKILADMRAEEAALKAQEQEDVLQENTSEEAAPAMCDDADSHHQDDAATAQSADKNTDK